MSESILGAAWVPPIGVPMPAWGMAERYPQAIAGVIQRGPGNYDTLSGVGTPERPIVVNGAGQARRDRKLSISGDGQRTSYLIVDGGSYHKIEVLGPADHVVIRNCDIGGIAAPDGMTPLVQGGGMSIGGSSEAAGCTDIVVQNCRVHDNGDWRAEFDDDINGIRVGGWSRRVWIVDCEIWRCSGDGVSIYAGSRDAMLHTRDVYVGRNVAHHNKQTGFWSKQATDVIFSENISRDHQPIGAHPSAWGAGMGFQYGPERIWFIANDIHDCCFGIQAQSTSGEGTGIDSYFVGNRIWNVRHNPAYPYNGGVWSNAAFCIVGVPRKTFVHNFTWDCDGGIHVPAARHLDISHNVLGPAVGLGAQVWVDAPLDLESPALLRGNLAWQNGIAKPILHWGSRAYAGLKPLKDQEGVGVQNQNRAPGFADPAAGDWTRDGATPVDNVLGWHVVYAEFMRLYGIDIYQRVVDRLGR